MSHAASLTVDACEIFAGRHAAKRMARVIGCSVRACEDYLARRRALSLDAAIELAARSDEARAALDRRIEQAKERNAHARMVMAGGGADLAVGAVCGRVGAADAVGGSSQGAGERAAAEAHTLRVVRAGRA